LKNIARSGRAKTLRQRCLATSLPDPSDKANAVVGVISQIATSDPAQSRNHGDVRTAGQMRNSVIMSVASHGAAKIPSAPWLGATIARRLR